MKLTLMLADAAELDQRGRVHALGLHWTNTQTPTPAMTIVATVEFEREHLPAKLAVHVELHGHDEKPTKIRVGQAVQESLVMDGIAQVTDTSGVQRGEPVLASFVMNIGPGIELDPGLYSFFMTVTRESDSASVSARRRFRIRSADEKVIGPA